MRFRDIEFRWSSFDKKYEIVKWYSGCGDKEYCCVVAVFDETQEGYDMRTIGSRFFEDKDTFIVGKHAIQFLNAMFYELEREKELE